jgi:hypothetical protein
VYELRSKPTTLGGAINIPSNGLRLLERLGVYDELITRGSSASKLNVHSMRGPVLVDIDMAGWIAVSMTPVMKRTSRIKEPSITTPGKRRRCQMRMSMSRTKRTVSEPTEMPKGIILGGGMLAVVVVVWRFR